MPEKQYSENRYLLFGLRYMPWVNINLLEAGEKKLNWRCVIAVTSGEQNLNVVFLKERQHLLTLMIRSIIKKENMIVFKLRSESLQNLEKLAEENLHIFTVRIGLEKRHENFTIGIKSSYH